MRKGVGIFEAPSTYPYYKFALIPETVDFFTRGFKISNEYMTANNPNWKRITDGDLTEWD